MGNTAEIFSWVSHCKLWTICCPVVPHVEGSYTSGMWQATKVNLKANSADVTQFGW